MAPSTRSISARLARREASTSKKRPIDTSTDSDQGNKRMRMDGLHGHGKMYGNGKSVEELAWIQSQEIINHRPTAPLDVYVFGEGAFGELGLGSASNATEVKRPRLNPLLSADSVGVVQVAVGGMHCAALTHDNRILTWGVNDQGALGRDTDWDGGVRETNANDSDAESDSGLNPRESTPTAIPSDAFPDETEFTQVVCGDSCTFALTEGGQVYGWGTFRCNEGIMGFTEDVLVQGRPMLIPRTRRITSLAAGSNHVLAMTTKCEVMAWGCGQQHQLGGRILPRSIGAALTPGPVGVSYQQVTVIGCGADHSLAVDAGKWAWAWGTNSFGETGVMKQTVGEPGAVVRHPWLVESLKGYDVVAFNGGSHHSIALTRDGDCLVWGRVDGFQIGVDIESLPEDSLIYDDSGKPRILKVATKIPGQSFHIGCKGFFSDVVDGVLFGDDHANRMYEPGYLVRSIDLKAVAVAAAGDTTLIITPTGQAYSWGFSGNYQTGQGTDDDIKVPTLIDCTAIRGRTLNWGGLGGQFGILTSPKVPPEPTPTED